MSVPRRFNRPQGLIDIDVLIVDDAPVSIYFNIAEVPEVITQGKSSFLIGWIEGIAERSNCLFCASFSISSSDFD